MLSYSLKVFNRLATHPFSYRFKDFIYAYRVENAQLKSTTEFLQPQFDERGNAYVEMFGELAMLRDQMNCIVIVPRLCKLIFTVIVVCLVIEVAKECFC